jgi:hypothetical protein
MLSEREKKTIVLILVLTTLILNITVALPYEPLSSLLSKLGLYLWGWIPAFILPSITIAGTLHWKPGGEILRGFVLFLSIISLIFAGFWFILFFISQLLGS